MIISFPVDPILESVYEDENVQSEEERIRCFGQNDHLRVFGIESAEMLARVGFEVEEIRGEDYDMQIKPVVGPADYDNNLLWSLTKSIIVSTDNRKEALFER